MTAAIKEVFLVLFYYCVTGCMNITENSISFYSNYWLDVNKSVFYYCKINIFVGFKFFAIIRLKGYR